MPGISFQHRGLCFMFLSLVISSGVVALSAHAASERQRPNILFIYTDDHSYRTVSCYEEAYPWARTPNIDRLARDGMRFESAYIGTWCMPSRANILRASVTGSPWHL